jgi:hypothetical protein
MNPSTPLHEGEDADVPLADFSSPENLRPLACQVSNMLLVVDEAHKLETILIRA